MKLSCFNILAVVLLFVSCNHPDDPTPTKNQDENLVYCSADSFLQLYFDRKIAEDFESAYGILIDSCRNKGLSPECKTMEMPQVLTKDSAKIYLVQFYDIPDPERNDYIFFPIQDAIDNKGNHYIVELRENEMIYAYGDLKLEGNFGTTYEDAYARIMEGIEEYLQYLNDQDAQWIDVDTTINIMRQQTVHIVEELDNEMIFTEFDTYSYSPRDQDYFLINRYGVIDSRGNIYNFNQEVH